MAEEGELKDYELITEEGKKNTAERTRKCRKNKKG